MIPLPAALSRSVISFNSCFGVIGFQSLAQRSAPNTTMPRDCSRSSVAGVDLEAGKAKERRARDRGRDPVQRHFDRRNAVVDFLDGLARLDLHQAADASRCDARWYGPRPRSGAPVPDAPRRACRSGRTSRARIHAPAPPAPSASSAATGRHRRSAPPRDRRAAASAESSSARPAGWWRHRRRECARCRACPCADSPPPAPPRSTPCEVDKGQPPGARDRTSGPLIAGAYLSLRLVLPIG